MKRQWQRFAVLVAIVSLWTMPLTGCGWFGQHARAPQNSAGGQNTVPGATPTAPLSPAPAPPATASPSGATAAPSSPTATDPLMQRIRQMTLAEKIGQMVMVGLDGTTLGAETRTMLTQYHVGGFIFYKDNLVDIRQTTSLLNALKQANADNRAAAPLWLGVDQEGGRVDRLAGIFQPLPTNRAIGQVGNPAFAQAIGGILGEELNALGFNLDFAPVLDVDSNPQNPVIGDRSFGPAANLVSKLGIAALQGIRAQGVVPVVKHFPGHGDTSVDSHRALPLVEKSLDQLQRLELVPFTAAVQAQAEAVMVAHILLPKLDAQYPASFSQAVITDLLRDKLHYDGVVITDDLTMGAVLQNYTIGEAAVRAVLAGADLMLVAHDAAQEMKVLQALVQNAEDGILPVARIDASVYRIMRLKEKYHLADMPVANPDTDAVNRHIRKVLQQYMPQPNP